MPGERPPYGTDVAACPGLLIGYARVFTDTQGVIVQRDLLLAGGAEPTPPPSTTASPAAIVPGPAWGRPSPRVAPATSRRLSGGRARRRSLSRPPWRSAW